MKLTVPVAALRDHTAPHLPAAYLLSWFRPAPRRFGIAFAFA